MAKRYGSKFSPDEDHNTPTKNASFDAARVDPVGTRANILFVPAIPLVFLSFNDGAIGLTLALIAGGTLTLAAWLLREGLRAEAAFNVRKVARRPAFPRKMTASLLSGIGVAIAAFKTGMGASGEAELIAPVLYGIIATVLHGAAFGLDPLKDKGMEGVDTFQQNRVARAVTEGETYLSAMTDAILRAGDRQIEARVERFQSTARTLFRTVEEDPRDLTGARKYLTIYLMGARDATIKFADLYSRGPDPQARTDYLALLDDLEVNFAARTEKMLLDDRSDLNIEIDVLRERLQREGVRPK
ncbi:MAG: 5-bromo-4-chloroindolyl phosphate hydrolysis family protein [Rhodobacteraceae bacterium]|nr:5-bromo-4-chloroindolyl phosphate hydrolysis family protein [Paracoccaceae bacterium]